MTIPHLGGAFVSDVLGFSEKFRGDFFDLMYMRRTWFEGTEFWKIAERRLVHLFPAPMQ